MAESERHAELRRRHYRKRLVRRVVRTLVLVGIAVGAVVGFTVYQATQARQALTQASLHMDELTAAVSAGDSTSAQAAVYSTQQATLTAQRSTGGPVWWLASKAPLIGDDVAAAQTVADVVDQVAQGVLPTLVDASSSLSASGLRPANGVIQLDNIQRLAPQLSSAHESLADDLNQIRAIKTTGLMPRIASPVRELETKLLEARDIAATASTTAKLLPPMLGADGPRTYLLLVQNNAEIRATGGIPGAVATITADDGALTLKRQGSAGALGSRLEPVLPLNPEEAALFTSKLGVYPADINFTPNFPRTARLAQAMWKEATGRTVDGVMSTDPVALSYLLAGAGPVELSGGEQLTADDAVSLLLNQVYLEQPDTDLQNAYFADAARRVFQGVTSGQGSPSGVLEGLRRAADERRTLVWSDRPDEQAMLRRTPLSGVLPSGRSTTPQVGVYLNDGTGAKMDYYLDYDVAVESQSCDTGGVQQLRVDVTMKSTAPENAAQLPVSVIGPSAWGTTAGSIRTNVLVYAPGGGEIQRSSIDGGELISAQFVHGGRLVAAQTIDLMPGESHRLSFWLTTGPNQSKTAEAQVTPGIPGSGTTEVSATSCR